MKTYRLPIIISLVLTLLGTGCSQDPLIPEFDYNLKSAKVIETNNDFGLRLLKTVFEEDEKEKYEQ